MTQTYTTEFFNQHADGSLRSARAILPAVFAILPARSVVDIGCGQGVWLQAARELGAREVVGVDGDHVDRRTLAIDERDFVACPLDGDFVKPVAARGRKRFDVAMCLEVAEHLPYRAAPALVERLTRLSDVVLFSAAVPFQSGTHHVNEQWPEFWALQFKTRGYACFDYLRWQFWGRADIDWWYAQNLLLFVRDKTPMASRLPASARQDGRGLSVVHPENYLFQILYTYRPHRASARIEELEDLRRLQAAWRDPAAQAPHLMAVERAAAAPAHARDVFPHTRTQMASPEAECSRRSQAEQRVAALEAEVADLRARLDGTVRTASLGSRREES